MAVAVHIINVEGDAEAIAERVADAGHTVSGPARATAAGLADAIRTAPGADVCVVVGGVGPRGAVPAALDALFTHPLPGFGELLRALVFAQQGAVAVGLRPVAGLVGERAVFALPADPAVAALALDRLILPDLDRWAGASPSAAAGPAPAAAASAPAPPPPGPSPLEPIPFGGAARSSLGLASGQITDPAPAQPADAEPEAPGPGWKRAVHALGAELTLGRHEDLPEPIEKLAPVVNVLHTAGEFGTLKLPSGRRYSVFGWPDLRRDGAKVLAIGWGDPLAEVVALHRHPREAGTCIPGPHGLLRSADLPLEAVAVEITGRAPPDPSGTLFAVQEGTVWILRGRRVVQWDGQREKDDGNPKQVLASLTLHWSNR